jgi:sodium transport system permease protein
MLNPALVIARKEIVDSLRDVRSNVSALMYALMGPFVVMLVSMGTRTANPEAAGNVLPAMMSVFALVAAFVGGMNVAMDTVAGERERRSLLPLLLNPIPRLDVVLGKWLAISFFSIAGLALNLLGFAVVIANSGLHRTNDPTRLLLTIALGILPLSLFAAALQLLISAACRGVKEAQTYLSMVVFVPMGVGMFLVFAKGAKAWGSFVPLVGQQMQLELLMKGRNVPLLQPMILGWLTAALAALVLLVAANRLQRDEIIYGTN